MFMYFWLNFSDRDNHVQRIPVAVKNIDLLFKSLESDKLRLFLLLYVVPSRRKKCLYSELFWSAFSRVRTEYGEILFTRYHNR